MCAHERPANPCLLLHPGPSTTAGVKEVMLPANKPILNAGLIEN